MKNLHLTLSAIEYAFVIALLASLSVVGVGGLLFGFQPGQWTEWQRILIGVIATAAGVGGVITGLRLAFTERQLRPHHNDNRRAKYS